MVLLSGGTGLLGRAIARRLLDQGRPVRILTRDPAGAADLEAVGAEVAAGDLTDPASLDRALSGVTHVVTTANAFTVRARGAVKQVDVLGNRNLIDAAKRAGVRQFVFTSAWLPDAYARIDFFAAKRETEAYLLRSGLTWTILRPAAFMEIWAMILGEPVLRGDAAPVFGGGTLPANFVAVDDVAAIAALALDRAEARNAFVDIFGPEHLTLLEVIAIFERIAGGRARRRHLPVPVLRALGVLAAPVNPVFARQAKIGTLMATVRQQVEPSGEMWGVRMTRMDDWARARYAR